MFVYLQQSYPEKKYKATLSIPTVVVKFWPLGLCGLQKFLKGTTSNYSLYLQIVHFWYLNF
uniref:Uncharacterized protein n=1 Tax=Arundo donax TaxID=35708 RepID=A0A0A9FCD7_ARUDO